MLLIACDTEMATVTPVATATPLQATATPLQATAVPLKAVLTAVLTELSRCRVHRSDDRLEVIIEQRREGPSASFSL